MSRTPRPVSGLRPPSGSSQRSRLSTSFKPTGGSTPAQPKYAPRSAGPKRSSGYGRPSGSSVGPVRSTASGCGKVTCAEKPPKVRLPKDEKKVAKEIVEKQEKPRPYELPPLSVLIPKKEVHAELEKLKAKTRRTHAPEGEDLKAIREILKNMVDQEITVHEFVGLLSPYTGDNGTVLRTILANELSTFRTMARRVYDNMTQDISDVLINEHVQLTEASKERQTQYTDKMMRTIDEIYEYVPNFNFEKYYADSNYLDSLFPMPKEIIVDDESAALQMRQEAYHRLMWLRSEGDRLGEENKRLADRLKELKQRQKEQMKKASVVERINEDKRKELEKTQDALEEQLEVMNTSIEKSIVEQEKAIRQEDDVFPVKPRKQKPVRKTVKKPPENWNVKAAVEIEESLHTEALVSEISRLSMASSASKVVSQASTGAVPKVLKTGARSKSTIKKKKSKFAKPKVAQDQDPFHYSPIKTPPRAAAVPQERSPFHYSPIKTPPRRQAPRERSPFHFSPPKTPPGGYAREAAYGEEAAARPPPDYDTIRVRTTTSTVEEAAKRPPPPRMGRRTTAPRDSWGGFA